jgi:hypothetical protein
VLEDDNLFAFTVEEISKILIKPNNKLGNFVFIDLQILAKYSKNHITRNREQGAGNAG